MADVQSEAIEESAWSWDRDEVNFIAAVLDAKSLAAFSCSTKDVSENLASKETLRYLAELRGHPTSLGISSVEHLEVAEVMAECKASIFFGWGSTHVDDGALPSLRRLATLMNRHENLELSIEAHCGLEARYAMPLPGQAREFTRGRAEAVYEALRDEAVEAALATADGDPLTSSLDVAANVASMVSDRVTVRAWGCSRPLVWCYGQQGMSEPYDPEGAAQNRRVDIYLKHGKFEVPRRRLRSEIPRAPNEEPLEDQFETDGSIKPDINDNDGTADVGAGETEMITVQAPDGRTITMSTRMLMQLMQGIRTTTDDEEDDDEDEAGGPVLEGGNWNQGGGGIIAGITAGHHQVEIEEEEVPNLN